MKADLKKKALRFIALVILAIFLNVLSVFIKVWNEEWRKMGSPYDIQREYQSFIFIGAVKNKLLNGRFSTDGFVCQYLTKLQDDYIQEIKNKVDGDDIIVNVLDAMKSFHEKYWLNGGSEELQKEALENFDILFKGYSRIIAIDKVDKYGVANYTLFNFINSDIYQYNSEYLLYFYERYKDILMNNSCTGLCGEIICNSSMANILIYLINKEIDLSSNSAVCNNTKLFELQTIVNKYNSLEPKELGEECEGRLEGLLEKK